MRRRPPAMTPAPETWHLIRIPHPDQLKRRRGFPPDRIDYGGMEAWCRRRCGEGWTVETTSPQGTVYRFRERGDAVAFALRWFPFKCG